MPLEQILITKIERLGHISWKRMFGVQTALVGGKLIGGYKVLDENVIYLMLILSAQGYKKAIEKGYFSKFDFGKTWVEAEITSEQDLENIWEYVEDSYNFVKNKPSKSSKPFKNRLK